MEGVFQLDTRYERAVDRCIPEKYEECCSGFAVLPRVRAAVFCFSPFFCSQSAASKKEPARAACTAVLSGAAAAYVST